ncbi:MAG: hypothetical protein AAGA80_24910 [Cyanobacteria bacterium P01_F01_bin.143]
MASERFNAYPLDSLDGLKPNGVSPTIETYQGVNCLKLVPLPEVEHSDGPTFAILENSNFHNGVIEISLSGTEPEDADSRDKDEFFGDFVGIGFRIQSDAYEASQIDPEIAPQLSPKINPASVSQFECIYFRPSNALDENKKNRTVQYFAYPKYKFSILRKQFPGVYESYAPIAPKQWFRIRLEVQGEIAKLYVNGSDEPSLVVSDLKLGDSRGAIGLFVERECVAYFSDLKITYYND